MFELPPCKSMHEPSKNTSFLPEITRLSLKFVKFLHLVHPTFFLSLVDEKVIVEVFSPKQMFDSIRLRRLLASAIQAFS